MAASSDFDYSATGALGDKRETMLENQLLLRSELGKPMQRGYTNYPGSEQRYGRPNMDNNGGASEALHGWGARAAGIHFPSLKGKTGSSGKCEESGAPERDFMALNRAAVQAGLTSSTEQYQFRATQDIRKKVKLEGEGGKGGGSRRLPASMVFGISTRPSTPIHDLLEHKYQDRWLSERRSADMAQKEQGLSAGQRTAPGKVYETRASLLRIHQVPVASAPLWQMSKFSKYASPNLETFRSGNARSSAYRHAKSDSISRKGVFGHGVYESATC